MLEELRIQNFAIARQVELVFSKGFNVITGETGAGKSLIVDAVELILGAKADQDSVRGGQERAVIEAVFVVEPQARAILQPLLEREDLIDDEALNILTLTREVRRSGRSSARINGVTVSAEVLREIGETMVDIHGQSAHLSLLKPRTHIDLLDHYADLLDMRAAFANLVQGLRDIQQELSKLQADKATLEERAEMLRYEVEHIEAAALEPDEESGLVDERNRLSNSEQLAQFANEAALLLNGDEDAEQASIIDGVNQVALSLEKLADIDSALQGDYELAESLSDQTRELALTLARYAEDVEHDPQRLDEIEERLELITTMKRRYKVEGIAGIIAHGAKCAAELEALENSDERIQMLEQQVDQRLRHMGELGQRLSEQRREAGQRLGQKVVQELQELRMENTRFEIVNNQREDAEGCYVGEQRLAFDETGIDQLEFMMSANPGQPLLPVTKVASGGEAARIMLALKRVLSEADNTPTLIFDEIDQGIGGRIGSIVGEKLWSLTSNHQVLCVTHLPQLASFADKHFHVSKHTDGQETSTELISLEEETERVQELADMLGARGESGRQSAHDILTEARHRKVIQT